MSEVPGLYIWRDTNTFDPSIRITFSSDGGYCHQYPTDGGTISECGMWSYQFDRGESWLGLGDFQPHEHADRYMCGFEIQRTFGRNRVIIDYDQAWYFVRLDGGAESEPH